MFHVTLLDGVERHPVIGGHVFTFKAGRKKPVSKLVADACTRINTRAGKAVFKIEEVPDPAPEPELYVPVGPLAVQERLEICR